jgi:hypothetical protein
LIENAKHVGKPVFPAIVKPNFGDNSWGIDARSVVRNMSELDAAIIRAKYQMGIQGSYTGRGVYRGYRSHSFRLR